MSKEEELLHNIQGKLKSPFGVGDTVLAAVGEAVAGGVAVEDMPTSTKDRRYYS